MPDNQQNHDIQGPLYNEKGKERKEKYYVADLDRYNTE
jgi:hypothetical protein